MKLVNEILSAIIRFSRVVCAECFDETSAHTHAHASLLLSLPPSSFSRFEKLHCSFSRIVSGGYYININNSYRAIFLLLERRYPKLTGRRRETVGWSVYREPTRRWREGRKGLVGRWFNQRRARYIGNQAGEYFLYRWCTITKVHKGWVRIVNFLKIPPANVQSREAAFECARWGGSEDWNLWQLFATGFLRYATAQFN